jgi:hypothetical protein
LQKKLSILGFALNTLGLIIYGLGFAKGLELF